MDFCCCLRIMCQMSIVDSYVVEFGYVISFSDFLYFNLPTWILDFLTCCV